MANTHSLDLESSSSQYASITDASQTGLDITGDLTIEAWVKPESIAPGGNTIAAKFTSSNYSYWAYYDTTKIVLVISDTGSALDSSLITHTVTTGVWQHIAITYVASTGLTTFYVDGVSVGTDTNNKRSIYNGTAAFELGSAFGGSTYMDGLIDDVRIWDDVRTITEIQDNLAIELIGTETNLQGYWKLNNDYTDETSNGNDLTASGSPVFSTDVPFENPAGVSDSTRLTTNLQGYWTLDEESGTRADSTANGNDLTDNNTVGFGTGKQDNAADFETSNSEYLSITDASQTGLDMTGDLSISTWINLESKPTDAGIISRRDGSENGFALRYQSDNDFLAYINGGAMVVNNNLSLSTWYHIVFTYDASAGDGILYLNGIQIGTKTNYATSMTANTADFEIGGETSRGFANEFDGLIDETGIWDKVLTFGEVQDLYAGGDAIPYAAAATDTGNALSMSNF